MKPRALRSSAFLLTFALSLSGACSTPAPCVTTSDCPADQMCINDECLERPPGRDGGVNGDAGTGDAGDGDGGPPVDAGGAVCKRACAEVDLDGDDDVDEADLTLLAAGSLDACLLAAADLTGDAEYDDDDAHALRAIAAGTTTATCEVCGACGDVSGDGTVDATDLGLRIETPCALLAADADRSGAIDALDEWVLEAALAGRATIDCTPCDAERECGDATGDGSVSIADVSRTIAAGLGDIVLDTCSQIAADVVRDGVVDRRDAFAGQRAILGSRAPLELCEPCPPPITCGDVNRDGTLNSGDSVAVGLVRDDPEATACESATADLNADGRVDVRDTQVVQGIFLGDVTAAARCPICSVTCGDVDQDGAAASSDALRVQAIEGGAVASICEWAAADINGDRAIDMRDRELALRLAVGSLAAPPGNACPLCTGVCGDADQSGTVTAADRATISAIEAGRTANPCELDDGDVDHDGDLDVADRDAITAIIGGTPPAAACGR